MIHVEILEQSLKIHKNIKKELKSYIQKMFNTKEGSIVRTEKQQRNEISKKTNRLQTNSNQVNNTLNINGLNLPSKGRDTLDWIKEQDSTVCCIQESKRMENYIPHKWKYERARPVISITNKIGFKTRIPYRQRGMFHNHKKVNKAQSFINVYACDNNALQDMKI